MYFPSDSARILVRNAQPRFFADENENIYWMTDEASGLVIVFANRQAVDSLYEQLLALRQG